MVTFMHLFRFPDALSTDDLYAAMEERHRVSRFLSPLHITDSHFLPLCLTQSLLLTVVSLVPPFSLFPHGALGARYAIPKIYGRFRNIFGRSHAWYHLLGGDSHFYSSSNVNLYSECLI